MLATKQKRINMLPSLLARDIQSGLKQFLVSAFEPADAFSHGLMSRFVEDEESWLNRPLKKCSLNASGGLISKKRAAQTRLRSDCDGQSGRFAGHLAHFGRTYPQAHA